MKRTLTLCCIAAASLAACKTPVNTECTKAQKPLSVQMALSEMKRTPNTLNLDFRTKPKWNYSTGLELYSFIQVAERYNNKEIFEYAYSYVDTMVNADGTIFGYSPDEYNIDHVNAGKLLFHIFDQTNDARFSKAADLLYSQMLTHPRTSEGGYWHKKVYPHQMWLDGLYMGAPFVAQYGQRNGIDVAADMVKQFNIVGSHTYDEATGLYRHGWDESKSMHWADSITGRSQHAWGRANGWYIMAMVDILQYIPDGTPGRAEMVDRLQRLADKLLQYRDPETGMWYQVLEFPGREGNYLESSCSSMFTYAFLKGSRLGYLDAKYKEIGRECFQQLVKRFVRDNGDGTISLTDGCAVAGLGGKSMRDGSYQYYISEPKRDNDPKAIGPFVMACLEVE